MKLIIPGAFGFVGRNLLKSIAADTHFAAQFDKIILVDILQYNQPTSILPKHAEFIKGSIYEKNIIDTVVLEGDVVLHLAVEANTFDNPQQKSNTSIEDYLHMLAAKKIKKFIFLSTADIYGINNADNITEEAILKPTTIYSANKMAFEAYLQAFYSLYGLNSTIFRPVTIYGPHQYPGWLVPRLITRALKNENIQITGDGSIRRDWIYISDIVALLKKAVLYPNDDISAQVFNIGTGHEETVLNTTKYILDKLGKSHDLITFIPDRPGDITRQITKAEKARKTFDWKPEIDFYTGLDATIAFYKTQK